MPLVPSFPTLIHQRAAEAVINFFRPYDHVEAVLVTNSCARGTATSESDLDMAVLISPDTSTTERLGLEKSWQAFSAADKVFRSLRQAGRFTGVHLDLFDGRFTPNVWDDGGGPDGFELEVGNLLVYSAPLWERGDALKDLKAVWLPYYAEDLRQERLTMVRQACHYDLDHIAFYVSRQLYCQAFDRLYKAFQEFLQALFIARRTYPLAYNKWIREQIEDRLGLPELYTQLPQVLEVNRLESSDVLSKHKSLSVFSSSGQGLELGPFAASSSR
jgi:predicted nucleotidyltransferase